MRTSFNTTLRLVLPVLLVAMMWSCNKMPYYAQYANIENQHWDSRDTLLFELHDADTTVLQHLSLGVRAIDAYKYRKLNLGIDVYDNGKKCSSNVIAYELFSERGIRKGDGVVYSENEKYVRSLNIVKGHTYRFKVYHLMRLDPIDGISNVYIQISDKPADE